MTETTKMTQKGALELAIKAVQAQYPEGDYLGDCVLLTLNHMIQQLDKRKSYKRTGPTKTQIANAELADKIVGYIEEHGAPVTCAQVEVAFGLSNQKASAILNRSGRFVKMTEGKGKVKATFGIAD